MNSKWLCFIFSFIFTITNAQTKLDSLYNVWEDKTQADSSRIIALKSYIEKGFLFSQPDSAIYFVDKLYKFSNDLGDEKTMAIALYQKGIAFYIKADFPKSLNYFKQSLSINVHIGNKKNTAGILNGIGNIYYAQDDYPKALYYFQRSLIIQEEIGNKHGINAAMGNIANIYIDQKDFANALVYLKKSTLSSYELDDKPFIASSLFNTGNVYYNQKDYSKALEYYQKSLLIFEDIGNKKGAGTVLSNMGGSYNNLGEYPKALNFHQKSIGIFKDIGDKKGMAEAFDQIGRVYLNLDDYYNAILNCKEGIDLAKEVGSIGVQKKSCECLYDIYKAQRNDTKALAYHELMLVLNDSLKKEETAKKLQRMEFSKQVLADSLLQVEKELKVEMVHQTEVRQKDKNKNLALGAGIFFLLLSGGFYSRWRYVKKSKAVIEKEKERSENLLLNILPSEIAEELKAKGSADAKDFDLVSILFTDFKGFTQASEKLSAKALIEEINVCFKAFDYICETHGIEKIKTIGDAYMAAGGLPVPSENSIKNTVLAALEMQAFITNRITEKNELNEMSFQMRAGINTGPVVAGIVGIKKFQYDIWGDTVNTASRMESSGEIGKVNISEGTYVLLKDDPEFTFESRGKIDAKGKGEVEMWFVETKLKEE